MRPKCIVPHKLEKIMKNKYTVEEIDWEVNILYENWICKMYTFMYEAYDLHQKKLHRQCKRPASSTQKFLK